MNAFIVAIALMGPTAKDQVCPIVSGRCDAGCKCFEGKPCICTTLTYEQAKAASLKDGRPCIKFVGHPSRPIKGCHCCQVGSHPKCGECGVVVCKPRGLKLWRQCVIDGKPLTSEILGKAFPSPKVETARRFVRPVFQPQFFSGGCANGQCGRR